MNAGATVERVHAALRRRILDHDFRPGDRLDPALIANILAASATPIREALHLLKGEGLVETRPAGGFFLPQLDEPGLKDLYSWSAELLGLAVRNWRRGAPVPTEPDPVHIAIPDRTASLFGGIAAHSPNREHGWAVERLNARLHAVRGIEELYINDIPAELGLMDEAFVAQDRMSLQRLNLAYHRRRMRVAAAVVRALYR